MRRTVMGSRMWRAAAGAVAAAVVYKASGASARTALRIPLGLLVTAAVGSVALNVKVAAKASGTEARLRQHIIDTAPAVNLVTNGGTIGGTLQVAGDQHVAGVLYGNGGVLTVGDQLNPNLGSGAITPMATGTLGVPGTAGNYAASASLTLAQIQAFLGTGGSGGNFWNHLCTTIDQLTGVVADIQSQLRTDHYSTN
jgi:hypothetical protein